MVIGLGVVGSAVVLTRAGSSSCASAVVGAGEVPPVFAPVQAAVVRTDPRLQRLIGAVQRSGFGRVIGAVGYDQTQWLRSAAVPGGFAEWTVDNAVIGFRDSTGQVRWGLRQTSNPQAWAVVGDSFLNLDLRPGKPVQVGSYLSTTGASRWCLQVGKPTRYGDPLTIAAGESGSTWLVTAGPTLSRISGSGRVLTQIGFRGVDRASFVREVGGLLVVGGRASHLLSAPDPRAPAPPSDAPAITAFDAASLTVRWQWGRGTTAHVLGVVGDQLLVEVVDKGALTLRALDLQGHQRWSTSLPTGTTADLTLRGGRIVVVRSASTISGYDTTTGDRRWTRSLAGTAFPYGFDLSAQPNVGEQALLGTTNALLAVDPQTGRITTYPLPTDGAATTFWPYEIAVSGRSAIVETNAGAVLVALRPQL